MFWRTGGIKKFKRETADNGTYTADAMNINHGGGLVLLVLVAGCVSNDITGSPSEAVPIHPVQEWSGSNSGTTEAKRQVINSSETWRSVWRATHANLEPPPALPPVDFSTHSVLAVFSGQKSNGGYTVEITEVRKMSGSISVIVAEESPGANEITTAALTAPYHFVVIPKVNGKVEFQSLNAGSFQPLHVQRGKLE